LPSFSKSSRFGRGRCLAQVWSGRGLLCFEPFYACSFPLASNGEAACIYVDTNDFWGVVRVAGDLQADVRRVTGLVPLMIHDVPPLGGAVVIVGTLGRSRLLDQWAKEGKLDTNRIAGKWESFLVQVVEMR